MKAFTRADAKERFEKGKARQIKRSFTKKRPYFGRFLLNLEYAFGQKTDPYRYMAALVNLFNLRSESACRNCSFFNTSKNQCRQKQIFKCPHHETTRRSIWTQTKTAKEEYPSLNLKERLSDPGNIIKGEELPNE